MREKIDYRNNLEQLNNKFPNGDLLTVTDVANFLGKDRKTVRRAYGKEFELVGKRKYVTKTKLARLIS